jgi:hypothetical protein
MEDLPCASYDTHELENSLEGHNFFVAQITLPGSIHIDVNIGEAAHCRIVWKNSWNCSRSKALAYMLF